MLEDMQVIVLAQDQKAVKYPLRVFRETVMLHVRIYVTWLNSVSLVKLYGFCLSIAYIALWHHPYIESTDSLTIGCSVTVR